jgi:hypothetical protein
VRASLAVDTTDRQFGIKAPKWQDVAKYRQCNPARQAVYETLSGLIQQIPDSRFRARRRAFTRGGAVTPEFLVAFLLFTVADGGRRGVSHLLEDFWEQSASWRAPLPTPQPLSTPSICNARGGLSHEVFRDLLWALDAQLHTQGRGKRWRGRRVFAVDGRKVNLNRSEQLQRAFGAPEGAHCPQALFSLLIDVCERRPVDFEIDGHLANEREHLGRMLDSLQSGDVLILDRGYPSHEVLRDLVQRGVDFVIRLPASNGFAALDRFRDSGARDAQVCIASPRPEHAELELRMVRREGQGGASYYLTSLARGDFDRSAICELYRMRWEIEECFKLGACGLLDQGLFRSKSENGVRQELGALTLLIALSRVLAVEADAVTADPTRRTSQKAAVLAVTKLVIVAALGGSAPGLARAVAGAFARLQRAQERVRNPRSFPRRSLRPTPKWGPNGRRGG